MIRPLALVALGLLIGVPLLASPASARTWRAGGVRSSGEPVVPRTFTFSSLPQRLPGEGFVRNVPRPRGLDPGHDRELERLKSAPPLILPEDLRTFTLDRNAGVAGLRARPGAEPLAPVAGNGFEGISQAGYIPGEPTVGAGPLNVFTLGNVSVTVTNKDGSNRVETLGTTFFGVTPGEGSISDGQCYYDAVNGRFVALAFTLGSNWSNFYLAISKTNDARGQWWLYKFDMTKDGTTQTGNWADYHSLGVSGDKIAMTAQMFAFVGGAYQYQKIRVLDRAAAYAGQTLSYVDFANFAPPPGGDENDLFVTKAARNLTPGDNTLHLLCIRVLGGSNVTYRTITGSPAAPTLSAGERVPVSPYSPAPPAEQKGTTALVPTNDCRPGDFYVRNGVLTCAWSTGITLGGFVGALRLFQLRTGDRAVLTDETYAASGMHLYFPAVTVDSVGTVFLGYDRSSGNEYPSSYATGRRRTDATLQPSVLLRSGLAPNLTTRWGDYTGMDLDATLTGPGAAVAWYAGQYTRGTNLFGTWINRLTFHYGQVAGFVHDDCDGDTLTSGDRTPLAGAVLTLKQGSATVATTTTGAGGAYNFGWLESGTYDVFVTPPAGGAAVSAIAGSGGNSQQRIADDDLRVDLANTQTSAGNVFLVSAPHDAPITTALTPNGRLAGSGAFTLTVNGAGFTKCSLVRWDGADRPTTWVSASQLTASIPGSDVAAAGTHAVTVFTGSPAGGTSNPQVFTTSGAADTQAPTVTLTSPVGGESWAIGSSHNVTWSAGDDIGVTAVDIAWSVNGGATFPDSIATGVPNTGSYAWTVSGLPSASARVRVVAHDGGGNLGADSSQANFTIAGWTVTASAGVNGAISPAGTIGVGDGATPSYAIVPDAGSMVADVLVNGGSVGAVTNFAFPPVHANQTIAATFAPATYPLNITYSGSGTVARAPDLAAYPAGSSVTLTATPAVGWSFDGWTGDFVSTQNPVGVEVDGPTDITAVFSERVYTWNQTGAGDWTVATNWTPPRTDPSANDMLVFSGGDSVLVTSVPTQTIGRLQITNNSTVALRCGTVTALTISGRAGPDLDIPAGSRLVLDGSSELSLMLGAAATGIVGGSIRVWNASHRILAASPGALVFTGGASVTIGTAFTGSLFGTGASGSSVNSVLFQNGSLFAQASGANPFGVSPPNSVVIFQGGSRYRVDGPLTLAMTGRTYADFEYNYSGATNVTGTLAFNLDSLIVSKGTLNLNLAGGGSIRGGIRVNAGAALNVSPASGTPTVVLAGAAPQTVNVLGSFGNTPNATLAVNNSSGVNLLTDWTVAGPLAFAAGVLDAGATTMAISNTGSVTGAGAGTGWVAGRLRRQFPAGSATRVYDVGDATTYAPVSVSVTGAAGPFGLVARSVGGEHPEIGGSGLDPAADANRWWSLVPDGSPSFAAGDATFSFAASDLDAGAVPAQFEVRRWSGLAWDAPATGTRTATSTQATGLGSFGEFAVGGIASTDVVAPVVSVTSPNGGEVLIAGANTNLAWNASDNVGVTAVDLLLSRAGADGPFDPIASGIPNTGSYAWSATTPYTSTALLRVVAHDAAGNSAADTSDAVFAILATTGVDRGPATAFALAPAYPNPMRAGGTFAFALPEPAHVRLSVLDVQGREVLVLADEDRASGWHSLAWRNGGRATLGAGLYFVRMSAGGRTFTRRFVLAR
ncbi:MAG: T9SS type A sorting domain-containing protein [Candidatus Eisenbacteria bacterium]|nr:T9SS type A sorting domain-containing protein [Candidatus Eisenbacteria bacterium]